MKLLWLKKNKSGQMTVELAIVFPVLIVIAVVLVNALSFAGECARFDRVSRNAIRTQTSTPALSSSSRDLVISLQDELDLSFSANNEKIVVDLNKEEGGITTYECSLFWLPTLFGMGLKSEVFGVKLFELKHSIELSTDPHRSGDIL